MQKKEKAQKWEKINKNTFVRIHTDILESDAFTSLTPRQMMLYIIAKRQFYGVRKPSKDHPEVLEVQSADCFYLNHAIGVKSGLYPKSNHRDYYRDIEVLIEHGFFDCISNGRCNQQRSIYRYSDRWKNYKV